MVLYNVRSTWQSASIQSDASNFFQEDEVMNARCLNAGQMGFPAEVFIEHKT